VFSYLVWDTLDGAKIMISENVQWKKWVRKNFRTDGTVKGEGVRIPIPPLTTMPFHSVAIRIISSYLQVAGLLLQFNLTLPPSARHLLAFEASASSLGEQFLQFDCASNVRDAAEMFAYKQLLSVWILPGGSVVACALFWSCCLSMHKKKTPEQLQMQQQLHHQLELQQEMKRSRTKGHHGRNSKNKHASRLVPKINNKKSSAGNSKIEDGQSGVSDFDHYLNNKKHTVRLTLRDGFTASLMVLFYTLYPSVVNRVGLSLSCRPYGDRLLLTPALSVECWKPQHLTFVLTVSLPGMLLFAMLIPSILAHTLLRKRRQSRLYMTQNDFEPRWTLMFGFMFAGYRENFEWWESLVMLRKCAFVLLGIFVQPYGPAAQVVCAASVLSIAVSLHKHYQPYAHDGLNSLESLGLHACLAQLMTALLCNIFSRGELTSVADMTEEDEDAGDLGSATGRLGPRSTIVLIAVVFLANILFFSLALRNIIVESVDTQGAMGSIARSVVGPCRCQKSVARSRQKRQDASGLIPQEAPTISPAMKRIQSIVKRELQRHLEESSHQKPQPGMVGLGPGRRFPGQNKKPRLSFSNPHVQQLMMKRVTSVKQHNVVKLASQGASFHRVQVLERQAQASRRLKERLARMKRKSEAARRLNVTLRSTATTVTSPVDSTARAQSRDALAAQRTENLRANIRGRVVGQASKKSNTPAKRADRLPDTRYPVL
jgi:hypothetical protein